MKTQTHLFPYQTRHRDALIAIITEKWASIQVDEHPDHTPQSWLDSLIDGYSLYTVGTSFDGQEPRLVGAVWVKQDLDSYGGGPAPIYALHILLDTGRMATRAARKLLHDVLASLFEQIPDCECLVVSGVRQVPVHRFLSRHPYGHLGWLYNSRFNPKFGLTDYWEWSVTRTEYGRIDFEAIIDTETGHGEEKDIDPQTTTSPEHPPAAVGGYSPGVWYLRQKEKLVHLWNALRRRQ